MSRSSFVTIASFETAFPAWIFRNQVEELGFLPVVTDEFIVNCYWLYSNAVGGVKVQVPVAESLECELALRQVFEISFPDTVAGEPGCEPADRCPNCDSIEILRSRWRKKLIFAIWLAVGVVLPIRGVAVDCLDCGFTQKSKVVLPKKFRIIHLLILMTLVALTFGISIHLGFDWVALFAKPVPR